MVHALYLQLNGLTTNLPDSHHSSDAVYQRRESDTHKIRYDTRCYFNVQSKADMSQLNLPHGTNNYKVAKQKN